MDRLKGKVVFITGAGAGIGRATAILLASEGAKVAVADIDDSAGTQTVHMIADSGGQAICIETDVTKPDSVKSAIQQTIHKFGKLDVIDNNAGGSLPEDLPVDKGDIKIWEKTLTFNLFSAFFCCKYGIPELIKNRGGSIILTGTVDGLVGWKRPAYTAAKGGIISLTRCIAVDYAKYNIRANCVCPPPRVN